MKLFVIFKWIVVLLIMLSAAHIFFQAISLSLTKEKGQSEKIIYQLQPLSKLTLPNKLGLVYIKSDTVFMNPLVHMAAQFAVAPKLLELHSNNDTILVYKSETLKVNEDQNPFSIIWTSQDKQWNLKVKNYGNNK